MTKAEIITRIIDRITDPWTDCPEDYADAEPINLDYAKQLLADYRVEDKYFDDEEDRLPAETTPELLMEAHNCWIRKRQRDFHIEQLAEWLTDNECVCEYDNYFSNPNEGRKEVYPIDFIFDEFPFAVKDDIDKSNPLFLIELGRRSKGFNPNHDYCWYDKEKNLLYSSNKPYADGAIDAEEFAEFILSEEGSECLEYIVDDLMTDDDIQKVFRLSKEEVHSRYLSC